jgi:hypothetical protein
MSLSRRLQKTDWRNASANPDGVAGMELASIPGRKARSYSSDSLLVFLYSF